MLLEEIENKPSLLVQDETAEGLIALMNSVCSYEPNLKLLQIPAELNLAPNQLWPIINKNSSKLSESANALLESVKSIFETGGNTSGSEAEEVQDTPINQEYEDNCALQDSNSFEDNEKEDSQIVNGSQEEVSNHESKTNSDLEDNTKMLNEYLNQMDEMEEKGYEKSDSEEDGETEDDDDASQGEDKEKSLDDEEIEDNLFDQMREENITNKKNKKNKNEIDNEIDRLENKLVGEKDWQVKGEVWGKDRPKDALLEADLDFKKGIKVSQLYNTEFLESLEDMIKRRINDEAWDDRKELILPKNIRENYNSIEELNFDKAKQGLAAEYEDVYKEKVLGIKGESKQSKVHIEISELFAKLNYYLDSLTNLSFTPKPIEKEKVKSKDVLAINIEEKVPIFVSTKNNKTANELFNPKSQKFLNDADLTTEDRQKIHRTLKRKLRNKLKEKLRTKKLKKLDHFGQTKHEFNVVAKNSKKAEKERERSGIKSVKYTKSSQFFKNIQDKINTKDVEIGKKRQKNIKLQFYEPYP